jgi:hypothetical protein
LSESLIKTVKEGDEEEEINDEIERARAAFSKSILLLSPDVKDDDKDKNDDKDKDKDKDDDEEEKEEEQKTPEQKEEKEETTTEASPENNNQTKSLMQTLIKPKEVIHDFNCFNRIWTKRYESIYFYKIKNNYHKEE